MMNTSMSLTINGLKFKIKFMSDNKDIEFVNAKNKLFDEEVELFGFIDYGTLDIYVDTNHNIQVVTQTIAHEITHAFIYALGMRRPEYDNEALCDFVASNARSILRITDGVIAEYQKRMLPTNSKEVC